MSCADEEAVAPASAACYVHRVIKDDHPTALLTVRGLSKSFAGVRALRGVDFDVLPGEVHCLLGQNGAGKSTLIKTLAGAHRPDGGELLWEGEPVEIGSTTAAIELGIGTMYQELDVVDGLTVAENIFLGHERSTGGVLHRRASAKAASELLARLGHRELSPHAEVGDLSPAGKQIVSMARALSHDVKLIIMDEPSAVLDSEEVANLFRVVEQLTAQGIAVVYISHRLEEIRRIGDRITVLKDGASTASGLPVAGTPTPELIRLMTGRSVANVFPPAVPVAPDAPVLLEAEGLALRDVFEGVDLRVRAGIGLSPEERKSQGLILDEPIFRNVTLSSFARFARGGLLDERTERRVAREQIDALELRPDHGLGLAADALGGAGGVGHQAGEVVGQSIGGGHRGLPDRPAAAAAA